MPPHKRKGSMRSFWYSVIRSIFNVITYIWLGMKVFGRENIPNKGAFIVASNHASYFDPPLLGTAMNNRLIHFMAKEELFRNPFMGWFLRYVHTFPVRRGRLDRKDIAEAMKTLRDGHVLGIYPEGTTQNNGRLGKFHEGMAAIALKAGVPVLPAAIANSGRLPKKSGPVSVSFGKLIMPDGNASDKEDIAALTEKVRNEVARLLYEHGGMAR